MTQTQTCHLSAPAVLYRRVFKLVVLSGKVIQKKREFFSSDRIFARIALKFFVHKLQTILLLLDTKNFVKLHRSSEIQPLEVEGYGPKKDLKKVNAGYFPVFLTCSDR